MRCLAVLVAATSLLTACADSGDVAQRSSPTPDVEVTSTSTGTGTSTAPTSGTATCVSEADGYAVEHPEEWSASTATRREPCRWFSPEPLAADAQQHPFRIPIRLIFVPHALDEVERLERSGSEVLSSGRQDLGGRPAIRQELRSQGEGLLPAGTRSTQWLVDFDSRTMIATTTEEATAGTYADNVQVLDAMMRSLRRTEQEPVECSARDLPAELEAQPGLPEAVQRTRQEVYAAAVRCDFDRLEDLIPQEGFTYSFGGGDDPTGSWRRAELRDDGQPPMRYLAGLLRRPYGTREVQGTTRYAWPSAFVHDSWSDVPQRDREALEPLYGRDDFERFQQFGGYVGYRVLIAADGTWRAFVAGD